MKSRFILLILLLLVLPISAQAGGVLGAGGGGGTSSSSGGGGGGGNRLPDIDSFIRQVESWKTNYPTSFETLQKLLYKPAFTNTKYTLPDVWLYYPPSNNTTINRTDPIEIKAVIQNTNPVELRRALYLTLEMQEPGENSFKPVKAGVQIIQVNEYAEEEKTSTRIFPEINSLKILKEVGEVKLRVRWTDGEYTLYSSRENSYPDIGYYPELTLEVKNNPPKINNSTMKVDPEQAKWDDFIQYTASIEKNGKSLDEEASTDKDTNPVKVTLHIYDNSTEVSNKTKLFLPGDTISFSTKDFNIFKENDSGKNFTYCYSCTDSIKGGANTTWTNLSDGPHLRPNPNIRVSDLRVGCEDENHYWWQNYNFGMKVKSLSKGSVNLRVDLYTDTPKHLGKRISSQDVIVQSNNDTEVSFPNVQPFDVADANQAFSYHFGLSAPDQDGKKAIAEDGFRINAKIMPYAILHPVMLFNLFFLLIAIVIGSLLIERVLQRGIEAQEGTSDKDGPKNGPGGASSVGAAIVGIANRISAIIGRKG